MVVLIVDALGWRLACETPGFANSLPHRRRIETVLGFSSGALPTLFTGRMPSEHGRWLMFRRARGATPFAGFQWTRALPRRVRESESLRRILARTVERRGVRGYFHLYDVPRWILPEFDLAERDDIFAPGGLPVDSFWDTLARRGVAWRRWNWRTPEAANLDELERCAKSDAPAVMVCYTADLDAALHHEGTGGSGVRERIARYGALLDRIAGARGGGDGAPWTYLLSDHGMVDVQGAADVMGRLDRLPVRWPRDYLAFFDSTMARFWWRGERGRSAVTEALAAETCGRWLEDGELERLGALFTGRDYGDAVFLLHPGVLMVPSFMGQRPLAAMHGYDPSHPDMAALLWSNRPVPPAVGRLADVRGFLEAELDAMLAEAA
jgi:hypothetical protein